MPFFKVLAKAFICLAVLSSASAFATSQNKDIYDYIDLSCTDLMYSESKDSFILFAREEIKENIGIHFCSLIKADVEGEVDVDYEAQRDYISMAEYSKLIDSLYTQFHFADSSPAN